MIGAGSRPRARRPWPLWVMNDQLTSDGSACPISYATVLKLARSIQADAAFDRLPILGDALEEAGVTDAEVLRHCRQPGDHGRSCWLVDPILEE